MQGSVACCPKLLRASAISATTDCLHVMQGVLQNNLQLLKASHLLDPAYFQFVMAVVRASSEMCSHKIRRTGTGLTPSLLEAAQVLY